jgi:diadenosine tetraphosphate (Ap4A) HIT family hydrolase
MKKDLPLPKDGAVFYEDDKLYATLANFPITKGHTVIVWKRKVKDLHLLKKDEYKHLMRIVNKTRNSMLKILKVKKVYLIYMDETEHVHWHLIPRYNKKGLNVLEDKPKKLKDIELTKRLKWK